MQAPQQEVMQRGPMYTEGLEKRFEGQWSDGLFSCTSDMNSCLCCMCCSVCNYYWLFKRMSLQSRKDAACGITNPCVASCLFCYAPLFACLITMNLDTALGAVYRIPESGCCTACCCGPCMIARMVRHFGRAQGFIAVRPRAIEMV